MAISCPQCHAEMSEGAAFCPKCGRRMIAAPATVGPTGWLRENIAGSLAYVTLIPAVVFLSMKRFKNNRFVRFHCWQAIFLAVAGLLAGMALRTAFFLLSLIPLGGQLLAWLVLIVGSLGWFILWAVTVIKAFQRERFKLPVIGDFAEKV